VSLPPSRRLRNGLAAFAAGLVRRPPLTADGLRALRPERILIVRQQNQMGDMVCATPTFRALRETWPEARIALVTAPVNAEVVRHNPHLDEILVYDKAAVRRPSGLVRFHRDLRNFAPDLAFVLASVSFSVTSAFIGLASGARWVVGADSRPFGFDVARRAFSLCLPANPELDRHAVDHSLAPLEAVGIATADRSTVVVPAPAEEEAADRILDDLGWRPGYWALHPGAGKRQNVWPAERFAGLARRAVAAGHRVLVLHGPADGPAVAALRSAATDLDPAAFRVAPACPVGVGAALLERAGRFACNDTGVMHVAGAVGVPTVALFGPTDPGLWKPPTDRVVAVTGGGRLPDERGDEFGWMESISEDEVWRVLEGLPDRTPTTE
jgi:ADP-heptose:LPS heptosyltransferase